MAWRSRYLARLALSTALSAAWVAPASGGVTVPTQGDIASMSQPVVVVSAGAVSTIAVTPGRSIINWKNFNIQGKALDGTPATTIFTTIDPTNPPSAVLNRVIGGGSTTIDGVLTAPSNMQLFILNSAGVIFGGNARVTAGSLIASTRNMLDQSFLDGKFSFLDQQTDLKDPATGAGSAGGVGEISVSGAASLVANGALRDATGAATAAGTGGLYLIGARVAVNGTPAPGQKTVDATGDVAFVAADEVTITPNVGSPLSITITQGTSVPDAIRVSGSIRGESVTLALASRDGLINTLTAAGSLEATNAAGGDGGVVLLADAPTTAVTVPGTGGASTVANSATVTSQSGYRVAAAGGITLGAATGTAPVSQSAADDISIQSVNGDVVANGLTAGSATPGIGALQAGGTLSVKGTSVTLTGAQGSTIDISATGELASVNRLAATGTGLDPTTVAAKVSATAGETVVGTASTVSGGVSLDAKGLILLAQATTSGSVTLSTTGAAEIGTIHGDSGVSVTAGSISATTLQSAKGMVSATATGTGGNGTIVIGTLESQATTFDAGAAAVTLSGQDTVSITQAKTASGTLTLKTPGALEITTVTGGGAVTLSGGSVVATTLSAGGAVDIQATKSLVGGADGSVNVGSITTTPVDAVNTTSNLTINADTKAVVSGPVNVAGDYKVTGTGVTLGTAGVDTPIIQKAGGVVTVTATAGDIAAAGPLSLLSDKGASGGHALTLNAQNGNITGAPNLSGGGGKSAVAVIAPAATTVSVGTVTGSELIDANGAVGLVTPGNLTVGDIAIGGQVLLDTSAAPAAGGASISTGAINAGAGGIAVKASGVATVAGAVSTTGGYSVAGSAVVLGKASLPIVQAVGGPITLQSTTGTVSTAGPVTLQGTAGAGQSLLVYGAGGVDLSGATIAPGAGPLAVNVGAGTNQSITLGTITADALGGAALANGTLTAQPTLGGSGTLTFDGPVQVNGPLTATTSNKANIVANQAITSGSDLSFTAAGSFSGAASTLTGRTVTAQAQGGDVNVGAIVAKAVGDDPTTISGSLTAQNNVTVGTATTASGQLFLKAGTTLSVGTANAGGAITLSAGGNALVDMATAGTGGVGDLTLTQAQAVSSRSGGRAKLAAAGALSLTATNALLLDDVSGGTGVMLKAGSVDATSLTSAGGPITGVLGGSVQVGTITTNAAALDPTRVAISLQGNDVSVGLANVQSGALLLNAGGTLSLGTANVGGAITLSAGNNALVDAAHAGLGGLGDLTLTQAQDVTSRSGGRAVFTAAGTLSLNATNALLLGDVAGGAGVKLNAGSLDATSLSAAGGPVTGVFGGSVQIGTVTTNAAALDPTRVAISLQGSDVSVDLANVQSGALLLKANGTLSLGTANVGGAITLSAANNALVDAAHAGLGGAGDLTLTQAQAVNSRAGGRAVFTAAAMLSLNATNTMLLGDVTGGASIKLNAGSLDATSLTSAGGPVTGVFSGSVQVGTVTTNAAALNPTRVAVSLQGNDVSVGMANLQSGALLLNAGGTLSLGTANVGGAITLSAAKNALVDAAHAGLGGAGDLTLTQAQAVNSRAGGRAVFTAAGILSLTATNALLLGDVSGGAGVALKASSVDASSLTSVNGSVGVQTGGSATIGGVNAGSGVSLVTTAGGDGAITLGTLTAGGTALVQADGAALVGGSVKVIGGDYQVIGRTVELGSAAYNGLGPAQTATGAVSITAGNAITGHAGSQLTADSDGSGAEPLTLITRTTAGGSINLAGTTLNGGSGGGSDVRIAAGSAGDTLVLGDVRARGLLGAITTDPDPAFAPGLSRTGPITTGTISITGPLILSSGDRLTTQALTGSSLSLTAGNGASVGPLRATSGDLSLLSNGGLFQLTAGATAQAGSVRLDGAGGFQVAGDLSATGGDIRLSGTGGFASSAGLIAVAANGAGGAISIERSGDFTAASLSTTGDLSIGQSVLPASVTVSGTTSVGGALSARIAGAARFGTVSSGGTLSINANSLSAGVVTAGGALALVTTRSLSAASLSGTDVSLSGGTLSVTDLIEARTGNATLFTPGTLGAGRISAAGTTTITAGSATIGSVNTGTVSLAATSGSLDLGNVSANGDATLNAAVDIRVDQATAGGLLSIGAGGDVTGRALVGGGYGNAQLSGLAGVSIATSEIGDAGGTIQAATVAANGDISLAGRVLALGTVTSNAGAVTLAARNNGTASQVSLTATAVDAATTATLTVGAGSAALGANNGALRVNRATAQNGALSLTAAGSISAQDGVTGSSLTAGGATGDLGVGAGTSVRIATATAGRDIGITAGGAGQDGSIILGTMQAARDVTLRASAVTPGAGGIQVGRISAANLTAQTLGTPATITLGTTQLTGDLQLLSTGDVGLADPVGVGGAATITAAGVVQATDLTTGLGFTAFAGTAQIGRLRAGGDLSITAGSVTGTDLLTTAGTARIAATSGDLTVGTLSAPGDVTLSAFGAAGLGTIAGNALTINASNLTLGQGTAAGPALLSIAGIATVGSLTGSGITANVGTLAAQNLAAQGDLVVKAAGDLQLTTGTATGAIGLVSGGVATLGSLTSSGALRVDANSVTLASGQAGSTATIIAAGPAGITNLVSTGDLSLSAGSVRAGMLAANKGALIVTATAGDLALDTGTAGTAATLSATGQATIGTLGAGGPLSTQAAGLSLDSATAGGNATLAVTGDATLTSLASGGNFNAIVGGTLQAGTIAATGGLSATGNTLVLGTVRSDAGPLSLRTNGGSLQLTNGQSGGAVTLVAAGSLQVGQLTTPAEASLIGASVTLSNATLGALDLRAIGGDATLGTVDVSNGVALSASGGMTVQQRVAAGGALTAQAGGSFVGALVKSGLDQSITAGTISLDTGQAGGAMTLTSTAGSVTVGTATAGSAATFTSAGNLTLGQLSAVTATLSVAGGAQVGALRTTAGPAILTAGTTLAATTLDVTGDLTIQAGDVTLSQASATGALGATAANGFTAGSLSIGRDAQIKAGTLTVSNATIGGALAATSQAGLLRLDTATIGGDATLVSAGDAQIGTLASGGNLSLTAANAVLGIVDSSGDATLSATNGITVQQRLSAGGALTVQASSPFVGALLTSGTDQSITASTLSLDTGQAGGRLTLTSTAGPLTVGTGTAGAAATLTSAGDVTLGQLSAATATLSAAGGTQIGTLRTTGGPAALTVGTTLAATTLDVAGDLTIQSNDVTLGQASVTGGLGITAANGFTAATLAVGGDAQLKTGTLTVSNATIGGGLNAISQAGLLRLDAAKVGGQATLTSAGDAQIGTLATGGNLSLAAVNATLGAVDISGDASLSATGGMTVQQRLTTGGTLAAQVGGPFVGALVTSGLDQSITAGTISLDTGQAGGAMMLTSTAGLVMVGTANAGNAATFTSAGNLTLGQLSAATATLSAAGGAQIGALRTTAGPAILTARTTLAATTLDVRGDLAIQASDVTLSQASATGALGVTAANGFTGDSLSVGHDAQIKAGTLTVSNATIGAALAATSQAGLLRLDTAKVGGNAMLVSAGDAQIGTLASGGTLSLTAVNATLGAVDVAGDVALSASDSVTVRQRLAAGGALAAQAGGPFAGALVTSGKDQSITAGTLSLDSGQAGGGLTLTSTAGPLTVGTGAAGSAANFTSAGTLTLGQLSAASATLSAAGGAQIGTLRTTGGPATLIAGTTLDATTLDVAGDLMIQATDVTLSQASATGALGITAANSLMAGSLSIGGDARLQAGALAVSTATIGGGLDATSQGGLLRLDAAQVGGQGTLTSAGDVQIGTLAAGGTLLLTANGQAALGSLASTRGGLAIRTGGGVSANTLSAAGDISLTAGTDTALDTIMSGGMFTASTGGGLSLRSVSASGDATLTASGSLLLAGPLAVRRALTATAPTLTLGDSGGAAILQQAGGPVTLTATSGLITGRAGLTLQAATGDLLLTAVGDSGGIAFDPASGIKAATGSVIARTTGLGAFGTLEAGGPSLSLTAADLALTGAVTAPAIQLANGSPGNVTLLGDAPAGVSEFGAGSAPAFALGAGELGRLHADTMVVNAGTGAVRLGDTPLTTEAGRSSFQVATSGRIDLLGGLSAAGSGASRTIILGGDEAAGRAALLRVAATPAGGGRLDVGAATLDLRADNIAVGLDAGFNTALGVVPGGTPIAAGAVASRYVAQPFSSLYNATLGTGGSGYTNPTLLTAGRLVVRYSEFAVFQNTGLAGIDTGLMLGGSGSTGPALSLKPASTEGNAFAFFGSINGIGGTATSLLGNDVLAVGSGVSRADSRANGCLIGAAGSGCLASNLVQPNINLFDVSRADVFRSAEDLTLPFEPLVSTNNEALFSDIASIDQASTEVPCAPGTTYCPTPGTQTEMRPETRP